MRLLLFLFLWGMLPHLVAAGPWPREKGTGFASYSLELWESRIPELPHYYASAFVEYGVTDRLTFGGKYAMGSEAGTLMDVRLGVALVTNRPYALSLELAVGQRDSDRFLVLEDPSLPQDVTATFSRVGLAYGRGIRLGARAGWVSTELSVISPLGEEAPELGLGGQAWQWDTTLGVTLDNDWMVLGQVFAFQSDTGRQIVKLAPGVAIPVGEGNHIEIGARVLTDDLEGSALALGFWQRF